MRAIAASGGTSATNGLAGLLFRLQIQPTARQIEAQAPLRPNRRASRGRRRAAGERGRTLFKNPVAQSQRPQPDGRAARRVRPSISATLITKPGNRRPASARGPVAVSVTMPALWARVRCRRLCGVAASRMKSPAMSPNAAATTRAPLSSQHWPVVARTAWASPVPGTINRPTPAPTDSSYDGR